MSENTTTDEAVELSGPAVKTMEMFIPEDDVNEMLEVLGLPKIPDAADLDTIVITVDHSTLMKAFRSA